MELVILHRWAVRPIDAGDFAFWHVAARKADIHPLWDDSLAMAQPLFSNLRWETDHYIVTPSPLYVRERFLGSEPEKRFEQALAFLVDWFEKRAALRRLVEDLPVALPERAMPGALAHEWVYSPITAEEPT